MVYLIGCFTNIYVKINFQIKMSVAIVVVDK